MIDNSKSASKINDDTIFSVKNSEFKKIGNLILVPNFCKKNYYVKNYQCEVENLLCSLLNDNLYISNSLHKYFKGENHSDYKLSEIIDTINKIEQLTMISAENFNLSSTELSINIEVSEEPHKYLESFSNYKGREFDKMRVRGFWYGIKYNFSEYSVKIYDKSELLKRLNGINIGKNILRFEIQYKKKRIIPIIRTLGDLKDLKKMKLAFEKFIEVFEKIQCVMNEDFSNTTPRERELYYAGKSNKYWIIEKSINRNTTKSKRKKYKEIMQKVAENDLMIFFVEELKQKIDFLLNN